MSRWMKLREWMYSMREIYEAWRSASQQMEAAYHGANGKAAVRSAVSRLTN